MLDSVRSRLALWHTAVLAALLIGFGAVAYGFLARTTLRRTDRYLQETATAFALDFLSERDDATGTAGAARDAVSEFRFRDLRIAVYTPRGELVALNAGHVSRRAGGEHARVPFDAARLGSLIGARGVVRPTLLTIADPEGGYRAAALPTRLDGDPYVLAVAQSLHGEEEMLGDVQTALLIAIPIALAFAWLGGYLLAARSLRPVVGMSRQAARISATNLHERLPVGNARDELGQLAGVFNGLLARLDRAFEQQRRFMADASHELRTPVAIMRGEADIALSRADRASADYRESLAVVRDEGRRLSGIVDDLLLLARADAGEQPLQREDLYLEELMGDCLRAVRSLAAQREIALSLDAVEEAPFRGDEELLRRLLLNLLDNAIKYTPPGGTVRAALARSDGDYVITVSDTGPGITPEARPYVFDRFYRADGARGHSEFSLTSGAGLGLAIARWVAEAHGGQLDLAPTATGAAFEVRLREGETSDSQMVG